MRFSLPQLLAFATLADCLSFTVAAERLHVTQPTLSATIRNLEGLLGARLFDRDTRKVRLTAFGANALVLALNVLNEAERAENEMREIAAGRRGVVRLAAQPQWFKGVLGPALREARLRHPELQLVVRDPDDAVAVSMLRRGAVDMVVAIKVADGADLEQDVVGEQVTVAVMPADHALAAGKTVRWQQLVTTPHLVVEHPSPLGLAFNRRLADAGIDVSWTQRVTQVMTAASLVESGYGVAIMSNHSASSLADTGLAVRELTHPRIANSLCLITRKVGEISPAARDLHRMIIGHRPQRGNRAAQDRP